MKVFEQPAPLANADGDGGTDAVGVEVQATWNDEDADPETGVDEPPAPDAAAAAVHAPENPYRWILRRNCSRKGKYVAAALLLTTMVVGTAFGVWERENRKINANQATAMAVMSKSPKSSNCPKAKSSKARTVGVYSQPKLNGPLVVHVVVPLKLTIFCLSSRTSKKPMQISAPPFFKLMIRSSRLPIQTLS